MSKVIVTDHPLIQHKLTLMRDKNTGSKDFRELLTEISMLMGYEITRNVQLEEIEIETPVIKTKSKVIAGKKLGIVPILRAGLGMVDGLVSLTPAAKVGHVGLYRDPETLKPVEYYCKLPQDIEEREMIIVDPMLATGGSAVAAIDVLKSRGANSIKLVNLVAAPEGIAEVQKYHPDVDDDYLCPDIMIVCDRKHLKGGSYSGVPKFIAETQSHSTAKRDRTEKKDIYEQAGVEEYWIVSPLGSLEIYYLQDGKYVLEQNYMIQNDRDEEDYNAETEICLKAFPHIKMTLGEIFEGID